MNSEIWEQEITRYDKCFKYLDNQIRVIALTKQIADQKIIDVGEYFYQQVSNKKTS